jgi:hypothetical protein
VSNETGIVAVVEMKWPFAGNPVNCRECCRCYVESNDGGITTSECKMCHTKDESRESLGYIWSSPILGIAYVSDLKVRWKSSGLLRRECCLPIQDTRMVVIPLLVMPLHRIARVLVSAGWSLLAKMQTGNIARLRCR